MKGNPVCRQMGRVAEVLDFGDQRMRVRRRMEGQAGKQRMGTETQARRRRERRTRNYLFSPGDYVGAVFRLRSSACG
ncbi:MAG: hypothetical protein HFH85_18980 [Lachnospiraceae bacterium]|nr:hypothetical protein [Lachnospiraceae bacterium]